MIEKSLLILQARDTGRILLKKRNKLWGFVGHIVPNDEVSVLFALIKEARDALGTQSEDIDVDDEFTFDYVGLWKNLQLFHGLVDEETPVTDDCEWCHLFTFPEDWEVGLDRVFENKYLLEKIVSPD